MNLSAVLIGLALALVTGAFLVEPYFRKNKSPEPALQFSGDDLEASRSSALRALGDLDFDFQTGKLVEPDYLVLRADLLRMAAGAIEAMDRQDALLDEQIEKEVHNLRKSVVDVRICRGCGLRVQPEAHYCRHCGEEINLCCRVCGSRISADDIFCSSCGINVAKFFISEEQ